MDIINFLSWNQVNICANVKSCHERNQVKSRPNEQFANQKMFKAHLKIVL